VTDALGAVLYEMATGSVPFEGDNPFVVMNARITGDPIAPRKLNREIPKEIEEIILHAIEREPHCRYASAAAMKADLDDPEAVKLTGRHQHLQSVQGFIILSALLPVLVFLIAFILFRCHGATH
jgi:serine/threonine protein kinase